MSVTAAQGFRAAGVAAGVKGDGLLDVALVVGVEGTRGAAVFTRSRAAAGPVVVSRRHAAAGAGLRAVVANSGCANAGTGADGEMVAIAMCAEVAVAVPCAPHEVVVCSTGSIGPRLDETVVRKGIGLAFGGLGADAAAGTTAATAIMTTDSVPKEAVSAGSGFVVGGMAKGAGMIRPDMATMLAVLTTDALVNTADLGDVLQRSVDESFNSLNVDGCQSTNDTVVLLASGASGNPAETSVLGEAVARVCSSLAHQIAADAEGGSRVVRIAVRGAADDHQARVLGKAIADSALVRSSFYGGDPNWGRILGALGAAPVPIDAHRIGVAYEGVVIALGGVGVACDEEALADRLAVGDFSVEVTVGSGQGRGEILTSDLTPEYVRFNGLRT